MHRDDGACRDLAGHDTVKILGLEPLRIPTLLGPTSKVGGNQAPTLRIQWAVVVPLICLPFPLSCGEQSQLWNGLSSTLLSTPPCSRVLQQEGGQ
jgi:hypothetical protein